jgi:hypothetical protein
MNNYIPYTHHGKKYYFSKKDQCYYNDNRGLKKTSLEIRKLLPIPQEKEETKKIIPSTLISSYLLKDKKIISLALSKELEKEYPLKNREQLREYLFRLEKIDFISLKQKEIQWTVTTPDVPRISRKVQVNRGLITKIDKGKKNTSLIYSQIPLFFFDEDLLFNFE